MPLTRNLYREDEVVAALMFCILRGRHVEAAFWCLEMIESQMIDELFGSMRRAWFYGVGIQSLGWLRAIQAVGETVEAERILELVQLLCRAKKDRSAVTLLATDLSVQPDRVNVGAVAGRSSPLEQFILLAIVQRRTTTAWGGLQASTDPDELLKRLAMSKHGVGGAKALKAIAAEPLSSWEFRAMACAALCLSREEFAASWGAEPQPLLREVTAGLKDWEGLRPRRRRVFPVPSECLYYFTERGRTVSVYDTTEKEIMGRLEKTGALWGSVYWDTVADWQAVKTDDTVREGFYDEHFPDDIPDEWSAADRAKSHGGGPLQRGAVATLEIAMERLLGRFSSAVIWGHLPPVKRMDWTPVEIGNWNLTPVGSRIKDVVTQ
jgi:hypothetical protein